MAGERQPLSEADQAVMLKWLDEHWTCRVCYACGTAAGWNIQDELYAMPQISAQGIMLGRAIPSIVAICKNCGNSLLFNGMPMRLEELEKAGRSESPSATVDKEGPSE